MWEFTQGQTISAELTLLIKEQMEEPRNEMEETLEELYQAKLDAWKDGDAPIRIIGREHTTGETVVRDITGFTRIHPSQHPLEDLKEILFN